MALNEKTGQGNMKNTEKSFILYIVRNEPHVLKVTLEWEKTLWTKKDKGHDPAKQRTWCPQGKYYHDNLNGTRKTGSLEIQKK